MAIKKRNFSSEKPVQSTASDGKLNIVANPKKPIPEKGKLRDMVDDPANADRPLVMGMGLLAKACGANPPDADFTIEDRVAFMRTAYDKKNPQEVRYRNRVRNRGTAITAMCVICQGGRKAVTECVDTKCPLWAFRMGGDPFYGRRGKK